MAISIETKGGIYHGNDYDTEDFSCCRHRFQMKELYVGGENNGEI